jgi:uncharacterized membrane protein
MRMRPSDQLGVPSIAAVAGHLIHLMLMVFSIASLVAALAADLAFWGTNNLFWARASTWLLAAGVVMGVLAAVAGLIEFLTISRVRSLAVGRIYFLGNTTAILLALANLLYRIDEGLGAGVIPFGLILSTVVAILLVTGWLGGEHLFRHRIGVTTDKKAPAISEHQY